MKRVRWDEGGGVLILYIRDLSITLIGSLFGGIITIIGVYWTIKFTRKMSHTKFLLNYSEARVHINNFIQYAELVHNLQNSKERNKSDFLYFNSFNEMYKDFHFALKKLNDSYNKDNIQPIYETLRLVNESAPYDLYKDLNGLIVRMATIYNSLSKEVYAYLPEKGVMKIEIDLSSNETLNKQLIRLKKRYKKINRKLKI